MKPIMIIVGLSVVAFAAGTLVSCSPNGGQAPNPVPPVATHPTGSFVTPAK